MLLKDIAENLIQCFGTVNTRSDRHKNKHKKTHIALACNLIVV